MLILILVMLMNIATTGHVPLYVTSVLDFPMALVDVLVNMLVN